MSSTPPHPCLRLVESGCIAYGVPARPWNWVLSHYQLGSLQVDGNSPSSWFIL